jgi:hypothetical protein
MMMSMSAERDSFGVVLENLFLGLFTAAGFAAGKIWRVAFVSFFFLYDSPWVYIVRLAVKDGFRKGVAVKAAQPVSGLPAPGHQGEPGPANTYVYSEPA